MPKRTHSDSGEGSNINDPSIKSGPIDSAEPRLEFRIPKLEESFTGRKSKLNELSYKLTHSGGGAPVVIAGLGGIGKTMTATKFIHDYGSTMYTGGCVWINAESYVSLCDSFRGLANDQMDGIGKNKSIEETVRLIYNRMQKNNTLIVFDNAEKLRNSVVYPNQETAERRKDDCGIDEFLPPSDKKHIHTIITSRSSDWDKYPIVPLSKLADEEAVELIQRHLADVEINDAKSLTNKLDGFPLTLQHAVHYIKIQKEAKSDVGQPYGISEYLAEFDKNPIKALDPSDAHEYVNYSKTTLCALNMSIGKIEKNEKYGGTATKILGMVAYLAAEQIPIKLFLLPDLLQKNVENAVRLIKKYCILTLSENTRLYNVHRLVQTILRERFVERFTMDAECKMIISSLTKELKNLEESNQGTGKETLSNISILLPHAQSVLGYAEANNSKEKIDLKRYMMNGYYRLGDPSNTIRLADELLLLVPEDSIPMARILKTKGNAKGDLGDYIKKKNCIKEALKIFVKFSQDVDAHELADCRRNLANAHGKLDEHETKKYILRYALTELRKNESPDKDAIKRNKEVEAKILMNLGLAEGDLNNPHISVVHLREGLELQEELYGQGAQNAEIARTLASIGLQHGKSCELMRKSMMNPCTCDHQKKKKDYLQKSYDMKVVLYGKDHFETAKTLLDLADAYGALGDVDGQTREREHVLKVYERHFGKGDDIREVAEVLVKLARAYDAIRTEPERQREYLERARKFYTGKPNYDHILDDIGKQLGSIETPMDAD